MSKIYLDNAASTPLLPKVKAEMIDVLEQSFANSSSIHSAGVEAVKKIERARHIIARSLNAAAEEIYFTSGGTESNNWVLKSIGHSRTSKRKKIVTSTIEHPSVLAPLQWLEKTSGIEVIKIGVDSAGVLNTQELEHALSEDVLLCSIMHVNNEVGSIQPLDVISRLCKASGVPLHVDACQSFLKVPLDLQSWEISYLTINAHKLHGPKGVGALYMKKGAELPALFHGGGHEMNFRSGTLNVPGIVGFGSAVEFQQKNKAGLLEMESLSLWLINELKTHFPQCSIAAESALRACHVLNVRFSGHSGKDIFWHLNKSGIAVSTASACSSNKLTPSHVLRAMGLSDEANLQAIRISLGLQTTKDELKTLISELGEILNE